MNPRSILRLSILQNLSRDSDECPAPVSGDGLDGDPDRGDLTQLVSRLLDAVTRYRADECDEILGLAATFLEPDRLVRLSDLPSAGDTSYAGVVLRDDALWTEYYTSRIDRDYPWFLALFLPTELHMARIPLDAVRALSAAHP